MVDVSSRRQYIRIPMRTLALVLAALASALLVAQEPTFRGGLEAVRVFTTVTDRDGRIVTTLTRDDFEVRDEGRPQPLTLFDNTPQPIRLIVMLDVSGSMEGNLPLLRGAVEQLVARLRPDDVVRLGTFGDEVSISPTFTHDAAALLAGLPRSISPTALTPLWPATDAAIAAFERAGDLRSVVLVLSDGKDSGPIRFTRRSISQADVIDRARRDDVMIYGIGMRSRGQRQPPGIGPGGLQAALMADLPDPGLALVAEQTGGGYSEIRFGQDLGAAFARVADELHSQYLLGFTPLARDGKTHDLDVRVVPRGLKVRARKGYVAAKAD
jgi:Ca-activated chloride channel family protein